MAVEIIVLFLVIIAVIAAYYILKSVTHLIVNTILGLILLVVSNFIFKLVLHIQFPLYWFVRSEGSRVQYW